MTTESTSMPPKLAAAICAVMGEVPRLKKGEKNSHGNYNFASIDDFLEAVRPLCAKHGVIILQDEDEFEVVESWLRVKYGFILAHSSGETFMLRLRRSILVNAKMGSQASGAGQSYVLKQFMRSLFQIATGEGDADSHEQGQLPAKAKAADKPAWRGPLQTTALKQAMRDLSARMTGGTLGTTGDLEAVKEEYAAIIEQAKHDLPDWHEGYQQTEGRLRATLMVGPASAGGPDPDDPKTYEAAE